MADFSSINVGDALPSKSLSVDQALINEYADICGGDAGDGVVVIDAGADSTGPDAGGFSSDDAGNVGNVNPEPEPDDEPPSEIGCMCVSPNSRPGYAGALALGLLLISYRRRRKR